MSGHGRVCPNCGIRLQHASATFELSRKPMAEWAARPAMPVIPYVCSTCGYVELYAARVTGNMYRHNDQEGPQ